MLRLAAFEVDPTEPSPLSLLCGPHIHLTFHYLLSQMPLNFDNLTLGTTHPLCSSLESLIHSLGPPTSKS
ncbi:uncharacterized protein G2W53_019800 [Senna tora]|uniref:Uncharacterized protein n=1 Tax=Senna tora TaxID=362788 RepID=A0A834WR27_9FABA|nr:uncharacterized protein G2W53_019800 [Senna tora]